jgi:hypothetical protein
MFGLHRDVSADLAVKLLTQKFSAARRLAELRQECKIV